MSDGPEPEIALLLDRLMRRIHVDLQARAACFDPDGVGPSGGMLLLAIAEAEPIAMQDIARRMARDKSQLTRMVQALEAKGLVSRETADRDARVSLLRLTDRGQETVRRLQSALSEVIGDILAPLDRAERDDLGRLLLKSVGLGFR